MSPDAGAAVADAPQSQSDAIPTENRTVTRKIIPPSKKKIRNASLRMLAVRREASFS